MRVDAAMLMRPLAGATCGLDVAPPLCPLGATAEAGCWKPDTQTGACAFIGRNRLDMRACHPAPESATEHVCWGFHAPPPGFHRRCDDHGRLTGRSQ